MAQDLGCWQSLGLMKMERVPECLQPPSAEDQAWALSWLPRLSEGGVKGGVLPRFSNPQGPLPITLSTSSPPLPLTPPRPIWAKVALEQGWPGPGSQQTPRCQVGEGNAQHILLWSSKPLKVPSSPFPWSSQCNCASPGMATLLPVAFRRAGLHHPLLLLSAHSPPLCTMSLGGSSHAPGCWGSPPVPSRCPSCGETWTLHPPYLISWFCPFAILIILFFFPSFI